MNSNDIYSYGRRSLSNFISIGMYSWRNKVLDPSDNAYAMTGANYKSFFTVNNTRVRFGWCAQYKGIAKYVGNVTTRKISTSTKRTHTYANTNKNNTNAQEKKQEQKDMIGIEC